MSPFPLDYLRHILDETGYLIKESAGLSKKYFLQDETLKRAFVRSIEIIGEAVKKLPADIRDKYPLLNVPQLRFPQSKTFSPWNALPKTALG